MQINRLDSKTTVKSTNGFKLMKTGGDQQVFGEYKYTVDGKDLGADGKLATDFSQTHTLQSGNFKLTTQVKEAGQFTDTLTFTFSQKAGKLN